MNVFAKIQAKWNALRYLFTEILPDPEIRCYISDLSYTEVAPSVHFWREQHAEILGLVGIDGWTRRASATKGMWDYARQVEGVDLVLMDAEEIVPAPGEGSPVSPEQLAAVESETLLWV